MYKRISLLISITVAIHVSAQQIDFLVTEYNQSIFQTGEGTSVPMGDKPEWYWPSFTFFSTVDSVNESFNSVYLDSALLPSPIQMPWVGGGYEAVFEYGSALAMKTDIPAGNYTFHLDSLQESTSISDYTPLANLHVKNYAQWQAFDPSKDLKLEWDPFIQGQGTTNGIPHGFIEVYIDYWDDVKNEPATAWSYWDLDPSELNEFDALPATTSSVTIPAGTLTVSNYGYTISLFFLKIDRFEDAQNAAGASVAHLRTMDVLLEVWPKSEMDPWLNYTDLGGGWIDTGPWMGMLNVLHAPWIYAAQSSQYLYIPGDGVSIGSGAWTWVPEPPAAP